MLAQLSGTSGCRLGALTVCAVTLAACATASKEQPAVDALVAAERAFATMAVERGIRASFLARLAADGLVFEPGPVRVHETWTARLAPADPLALKLEWAPAAAAVAASGEIGFTTGPFILTDRSGTRPPQHGIYTSVWRKNSLGVWQVVLDAGVLTNAPVDVAALMPAPKLHAAASKPNFPQMLSPAEIERSLRNASPEAFASWLAADTRWYRNGTAPILAREPVATAFRTSWRAVSLSHTSGAGSATGDFAYTYGMLTVDWVGATRSTGDYVNLWSRDEYGVWKIAVAIWLQAWRTE